MGDPVAVRVHWNLLGEWWCCAVDADPGAVAERIREQFETPEHRTAHGDARMVADRLYGGFRCADFADRVHLHFATGQYTYLGPNTAQSREERADWWRELLEKNGADGWAARGPFLEGAELIKPHAFGAPA